MIHVHRGLVLFLLLGLLSAGSATAAVPAASVSVAELNYVFAPDQPKIRPGDSVIWVNEVGTPHTATGDAPLSLWDSGLMQHNETFELAFTAGGTYAYHCDIHEGYGMYGRIQVADLASPPSGTAGTIFTVTVASVDAPADYVYDIQKRNPTGGFRIWQRGITTLSATFDSTGQMPGRYGFRSRLRRVSDGAATLYSPTVAITVTA